MAYTLRNNHGGPPRWAVLEERRPLVDFIDVNIYRAHFGSLRK